MKIIRFNIYNKVYKTIGSTKITLDQLGNVSDIYQKIIGIWMFIK